MKRLIESLQFLKDFINRFDVETTAIYCVLNPSDYGLNNHKALAKLFAKHEDMLVNKKGEFLKEHLASRPNKRYLENIVNAIEFVSIASNLLSQQDHDSSEPVVIEIPLVIDSKFIESKKETIEKMALMKTFIDGLIGDISSTSDK